MQPTPNRRDFLGGALAGLAGGALAGCSAPPTKPDATPVVDASTDWSVLRRLFLLEPGLAYMNNAGLGPSPRPVLDTVYRKMLAQEAVAEEGHRQIEPVRRRIAAFLNCRPDELGITRSTTESVNLVARGLRFAAGDEILMTTHEHPGGSMPWFTLARDTGVVPRTFAPGGSADACLANFGKALTARTRLVCVSHITCTTGQILPVAEIGRRCRERGILLALDGAQAVGQVPVDLRALGCDFYATSPHKWLLAPKGTGLLYVRRELQGRWRPVFGGAYVDKRYDLEAGALETIPAARSVEYGTRNTPIVLGLDAAVDLAGRIGVARIAARCRLLAARLRVGLAGLDAVEILTPLAADEAAGITTFRPRGLRIDPGRWTSRLLREHRIRTRPVHEAGLAAVRVSTHYYNTPAEVDRLLAALPGLLRG